MKVDLYGQMQGTPGTQRTIKVMRKLKDEGRIDPTIIFIAQQLARNYDRKDYRGQAQAIHKFVQKYIHYVKDPKATEMVRSPFWTLYYRAGDCDDQSVLVAALAEAIGFSTRYKAIKADPTWPGEFSHVYTQIQIPTTGEWVTSDTIVPGVELGWEANDRFGARTWGGVGQMEYNELVNLNGLGGGFQDFFKSVGESLKESVKGAINKATSTQPVASAPPPSVVPSWLLPVGLATLVGAIAIKVLKKKS